MTRLQFLSINALPQPLVGYSLVYDKVNSCFYFLGGASHESSFTNLFYQLKDASFVKLPCSVANRYDHWSCIIKDTIYTLFGCNETGLLEDILEYNLTTKEWKSKPLTISHRISDCCVVDDFILTAGGGLKGLELVDDCGLHSYNSKEEKWTLLSTHPECKRLGHTIDSIDNQVFLVGGRNETSFLSVLVFNLEFSTWTSIDTSIKVMGHASDVYKNYIIIHGGLTENNSISNTIYILDSSKNKINICKFQSKTDG
jgi:hypothetical protein